MQKQRRQFESYTHFITADGFRIYLGHYLKDKTGKVFQVVEDKNFQVGLYDIEKDCVNKLTDNLAKKLYAMGYEETMEIEEEDAR